MAFTALVGVRLLTLAFHTFLLPAPCQGRPQQPTWICPSSSPRLLMPVSKDLHSLHLPTLLYPWTSHTWIQSLFIMASPPEHRSGFPRSAHSSHVAVDREPRPWMLSLFLFVSLCMREKALHSQREKKKNLYCPTLFICLLTGIHARLHSLFLAAPPRASHNGSSHPGIHTPGCSSYSSRRLLMNAEKDSHSLHFLLMWLFTGTHTPGRTPSSSSRLCACPEGSPLSGLPHAPHVAPDQVTLPHG